MTSSGMSGLGSPAAFYKMKNPYFIYCGIFILNTVIEDGCLGSLCRESLPFYLVHDTVLAPGHTKWNFANPLDNIDTVGLCAYYTSHNESYRGFVFNTLSKLCTPVYGVLPANTSGVRDVEDTEEKLYLDVKLECPDQFELYACDDKISCLRFSSLDKFYDDAETLCNDWGGHLVEIKTAAKLDLVKSLASGRDVWIGLDDNGQEGVFVYHSDGSVLTTEQAEVLFSPGEPWAVGVVENCVHIWSKTGLLNDAFCLTPFNFVCEIHILE